MSMADVKRAFVAGLNGKASCQRATMGYETNPSSGLKEQRLEFRVSKGGSSQIVSELIPANADLVEKARRMGELYAETLGG